MRPEGGPKPTPTRKDGRRATAAGLAASAVVHASAVWVAVSSRARFPAPAPPPSDLRLIVHSEPLPETPPAVHIPPPHTPIPVPEPPLEAPLEAPRSPSAPTAEPPEYVPHDVPPRLVNAADVMGRLAEEYPEELEGEAVESRVLLWLYVDTGGRVEEIRLQVSSGYPALDDLARRVAPTLAYRPALHAGRRVAVWVAQGIRFRPP